VDHRILEGLNRNLGVQNRREKMRQAYRHDFTGGLCVTTVIAKRLVLKERVSKDALITHNQSTSNLFERFFSFRVCRKLFPKHRIVLNIIITDLCTALQRVKFHRTPYSYNTFPRQVMHGKNENYNESFTVKLLNPRP